MEASLYFYWYAILESRGADYKQLNLPRLINCLSQSDGSIILYLFYFWKNGE